MIPERLELLRRLTLNDQAAVARVTSGNTEPTLDPKTVALIRLAALAAQKAETPSYQTAVDVAHAASADDAEIVETILSVATLIGTARTDAAIRPLSEVLGLSFPG